MPKTWNCYLNQFQYVLFEYSDPYNYCVQLTMTYYIIPQIDICVNMPKRP